MNAQNQAHPAPPGMGSFVEDAIIAGGALVEPKAINRPGSDDPATATTPFVVVPKGYALTDLERLFPVPQRKRGTVVLKDMRSFIELVNAEKGASTRMYSNLGMTPSFTAVFNDSVADNGPGWGDHRATWACPLSPEWTTWLGMNKAAKAQADFAQFIEDNALDIESPEPAIMIEVARSIEGTRAAKFKTGIRLANGDTQFTYEESTNAVASKGQVEIPEKFTLAIPVFQGGDRWRIEARLRYRIDSNGNLAMWFDMLRPHKVMETALDDVVQAIKAQTDIQPLHGDPLTQRV